LIKKELILTHVEELGGKALKQKLILFLASSIPFGVIMGLLFVQDKSMWLKMSLLYGLLFGVLQTIVLSIIQAIQLRKFGDKGNKIKVNNSVKLVVDGLMSEIVDLCKQSINALEKGSIDRINKDEGEILARTGTTWLSFGESISYQVEQISDSHCSITVKSRPLLRTTVIDYGKSRDNIRKIANDIRQTQQNIKVLQDDNGIIE